jgi:hypothetical protein
VLFADLNDLRAAQNKNGFRRVQQTCRQTVEDGLDYVWIDSCCIDKSSSAELSGAINSMFIWYKNSHTCYAYLADVEHLDDFSDSKWFTRAWTLQELLAPSSRRSDERKGFRFFSRDWGRLGSKADLVDIIAHRTGVEKSYLTGKNLDAASISMRMSWAAGRKATRSEDIAYSLCFTVKAN